MSGATAPVAVTVGQLVAQGTARLAAAASESARLDAELLLGHVLGIGRTTVLAHPGARVGIDQAAAFEAALARRERGEPVAYIRGIKEFHGLAFAADGRALIPRPETERLVELAELHIRSTLTGAPRPASRGPVIVWDVGTGCGAIAVALAVTLRRRGYADAVRFLASDVSPDALALAVENAVGHGVVDLVELVVGDLTEVTWRDGTRPVADLIVANLPYVPTELIARLPVAASFEPREALDGGPDGLGIIRRLIDGLPRSLGAGGTAMLEIGGDQETPAVAAARAALTGWAMEVYLDLSGAPRVLRLDRPT